MSTRDLFDDLFGAEPDDVPTGPAESPTRFLPPNAVPPVAPALPPTLVPLCANFFEKTSSPLRNNPCWTNGWNKQTTFSPAVGLGPARCRWHTLRFPITAHSVETLPWTRRVPAFRKVLCGCTSGAARNTSTIT